MNEREILLKIEGRHLRILEMEAEIAKLDRQKAEWLEKIADAKALNELIIEVEKSIAQLKSCAFDPI
jgi:hypothetical protein